MTNCIYSRVFNINLICLVFVCLFVCLVWKTWLHFSTKAFFYARHAFNALINLHLLVMLKNSRSQIVVLEDICDFGRLQNEMNNAIQSICNRMLVGMLKTDIGETCFMRGLLIFSFFCGLISVFRLMICSFFGLGILYALIGIETITSCMRLICLCL